MLGKSRYLNQKDDKLLTAIMGSDLDIPRLCDVLSESYTQALEAEGNDPDAAPDDKKDDKKDDKSDNTDPDAGGDDDADDNEGNDPDNAGDDENNNPDNSDDQVGEGNDPDFTKGADPGTSSDPDGGANPDGNASAGGGAGSPSGDVEPPKNEEDKEEKVKDISERIHLYSCYNKLSALVESLVNNMQAFVDSAVSIEQRNIVLRIKQALIKTSGQLEFAMALNFKTADFEKLEELYDIINTKVKKFVEELEKVKKVANKK